MIDFDLGDLDALAKPLQDLRPAVDEAYKQLDAKWSAVVATLSQCPLPCDIRSAIWENPDGPPDSDCLEFRKIKGRKRICLVSYRYEDTPYGPEESESISPYEEWSGEQRLAMYKHVPNLFTRGAEQVKRFIEQAKA